MSHCRSLEAPRTARARIADYWIVDLAGRVLEVHREPLRPGSARPNWRYASVEMFGREAMVSPFAAPDSTVVVSDLLP